MRHIVRLEILGREYTVRSDEEEEWVQKIAAHVNRKFSEVSQNFRSGSPLNIAILAALNLADDYLRLEERQEKTSAGLATRSSRLIELIDAQMDKKIPCGVGDDARNF